jgi:rubrerythrin
MAQVIRRQIMNVLDHAVKNEKEAIKLYRYLSGEASLLSLKSLFTALMSDEERHLDRIDGIRKNNGNGKSYQPVSDELSRLFIHIVNDRGVVSLSKEEVRLYREVMDNEKKVLAQYEVLLGNENSEEIKDLLEKIILQEKQHFSIVKDLCVLISEQQSAH